MQQSREQDDDAVLQAQLAEVDEVIRATSTVLEDAVRADREAESKVDGPGSDSAWTLRVDAHFSAQDQRVEEALVQMSVNASTSTAVS